MIFRGLFVEHYCLLFLLIPNNHSSLDEYLKKEGIIERSLADRIFIQLLEALAYLSEQRVLHRDICPANILMDDKKNAKLGDFGLGKHLVDCEKESRVSEAEGHTSYMAPEMRPRKRISEAADIYSLGLVYFRMLLHTHVWAKNSSMESKVNKFRTARRIPKCMGGNADKNAITLIKKMTSSKPWERPSAVNILEGMKAQADFANYEWIGDADSPARERYLYQIAKGNN